MVGSFIALHDAALALLAVDPSVVGILSLVLRRQTEENGLNVDEFVNLVLLHHCLALGLGVARRLKFGVHHGWN